MHVEIPAGQAIRIQFDDGRETSIAAVPAAVPQSKRRSNVLVCSMLFGAGMFGAGMLYQGSRAQNTPLMERPQPTAEKIVPAPPAPQPVNPFGLKP